MSTKATVIVYDAHGKVASRWHVSHDGYLSWAGRRLHEIVDRLGRERVPAEAYGARIVEAMNADDLDALGPTMRPGAPEWAREYVYQVFPPSARPCMVAETLPDVLASSRYRPTVSLNGVASEMGEADWDDDVEIDGGRWDLAEAVAAARVGLFDENVEAIVKAAVLEAHTVSDRVAAERRAHAQAGFAASLALEPVPMY